MTTTHLSPATGATRSHLVVLRWMASFPGFPLGGLAAMLLVGPVDSTATALLGGAVTGTVLGVAQSFGRRLGRQDSLAWTIVTALGLAVGLALGAGTVGHGTDLGDLVIQGAVSGAVVGAAQGVVLVRSGVRFGLAWPAYVAGTWALGWTLTTLVGVQVEDQFTVFGAVGAVTVTALTSVLPVVTRRTR
jgi:hypothetical protein